MTEHMKTGSRSVTKEIMHIHRVEDGPRRNSHNSRLLSQDWDKRAGTDEPVSGRGPTCCQGPNEMESAH